MSQDRVPRAPTPRETQLSVLDKSRRRCALCFHLNGDLNEKHGQIAHLDRNRSNPKEDNLAFLCLEHHSLFDSTTSQHKGYTADEAKVARADLYQAVERGLHLTSGPVATAGNHWLQADRETFNHLMRVLPSNRSIRFLRDFSFGNCFNWDCLDDLTNCRYECAGPEHELLDQELESYRDHLVKAISSFQEILTENVFRLKSKPTDQNWYSVPSEWHFNDPARWHHAVNSINAAADRLVLAYDNLVRECRRKLLI